MPIWKTVRKLLRLKRNSLKYNDRCYGTAVGKDGVNDKNLFTVSSPPYINFTLLISPYNQTINLKASGDTYFVHILDILNLDILLKA